MYQVYYRATRRLAAAPALVPRGATAPAWRTGSPLPDLHIRRGSIAFCAPATFRFLNREVAFGSIDAIDWEFSAYGKLFSYNLNYFDWLLRAPNPADARDTLEAYTRARPLRGNRYEPYPTSLRLVNWIAYYQTLGTPPPPSQLVALAEDWRGLFSKREYHLSGNHLLENRIALYIGAVVLGDSRVRVSTFEALVRELDAQYLPVGLHYERSYTYHALLYLRLLYAYAIAAAISREVRGLDAHVATLGERLRAQLSALLFALPEASGYPRFNDVDPQAPPRPRDLLALTARIDPELPAAARRDADAMSTCRYLASTGYWIVRAERYLLIADAGPIGPDHIPGHGHCDALSFCLYDRRGRELLTDPGTSTYEVGAARQRERSTRHHNTVQVGHLEQAEIWGAFRIGRRMHVGVDACSPTRLDAHHDGYTAANGPIHYRGFEVTPTTVTVVDRLRGGSRTTPATARLHFGPDVGGVELRGGGGEGVGFSVSFEDDVSVCTGTYAYATGFNDVREATVVEVGFARRLTTTISLE